MFGQIVGMVLSAAFMVWMIVSTVRDRKNKDRLPSNS